LWEMVEDELKDRWPGAFPHASHDSKANAVGDIACTLAGWGVARQIRRR